MRSLSDYISPSYDGLNGRESIEWANFWYSHANYPPPHQCKRILLIGDSTARMVRSTFENYMSTPVDMIGTSCGLHDILFIKQIEAFFTSSCFKYSDIFIQLGHHSIRGENGEVYVEADFERFQEDYIGLINYLHQYTTNIVLLSCFLNVTPLPKRFNTRFKSIPVLIYRKIFGEKIDHSWSDVVIRKNCIIEKIAIERNLKFCDIDGRMRAKSKGFFPRFIHQDHIHYLGSKAKMAIVSEYAKYLSK